MSILFGTKYKDEKLVVSAEHALIDEPTIDASFLTISSEKGVVTIGGKLKTALAKRHAVEAVERSFKRSNLKYDKIVDSIELG